MVFFLYFLTGIFMGRLSRRALEGYLEEGQPFVFKATGFSPQDPLFLWLEGGLGIVSSLAFLKFGGSLEGFIYATLSYFLLFLSLVDFKKYTIPDNILLCIAFLYLLNRSFGFIFLDWLSFYILFFMAFFLKISYLLVIRKNVLGWGDVKLFSLCGLWIPLESIPIFLLIAGSGGLFLHYIWHGKGWGKSIPLGPPICFALWVIVTCF